MNANSELLNSELIIRCQPPDQIRGAKTIHILGVPMDLGSGRRGVDMGPSAIRIAGLNPAPQRAGASRR